MLLFASPAAAKVHKVRRGDSLARIAKKYHVSVEELRSANSLASDDLDVGARLVVPARGAKGGKEAVRTTKGKAAEGKGAVETGGDGPSRKDEQRGEASSPAPQASASARADVPKGGAVSPVPGKGGEIRVDPGSASGKGTERAARKHKVRRGDSLARIAKKYRVSVEDLRAANSLSSDDLAVGTRLLVPSGPSAKAGSASRESVAAASGKDGAPKSAFAGEKGAGEPPAASTAGTGRGKAARKHKVRRGDSLARIAKKYRVSVEDLRAANSLASDDLTVGTRLVIPFGPVAKGDNPSRAKGPSSRTAEGGGEDSAAAVPPASPPERHKVKKGDTLASIAREHHLSVRELRRLNRMGRKARLRPGSAIVVSRAEGRGRRGPDPETVDRKMRIVAAIPVVPGSEGGALPLREGSPKGAEACANPPGGEAISSAPAPAAEGDDRLLLAAEGDGETHGWDITGKILSLAKSMLDVPYRFGGSSFRGIDCSGYVQKVFSYLNIPLPRSAREQFQRGERIEREQLAKGDLVFFQTYARFPSHVGIYVGDNQFIHASSRDHKVRIDSLDAPYYVKRYIGARRMQGLLGGESAGLESAAEPIPGTVPEKKPDSGVDGP